MDKTIRSFVNNDDYEKYLNNKQKEIKDTGTIIENVYIDNKISVKNTKVPVDKTIYENVDDLSKYLMPILANKQKKCKLSKWIESDYAKKVGRYKKDSKGKYYKLK